MSENGSLECDGNSPSHSTSPQSLCSDDFREFLEEPMDRAQHGETSTCPSDTCTHPGYLAGMCIRCGADKPEEEEAEGSFLPFGYVHQDLELSKEEVDRLSEWTTTEAEARRKLQLVLDLDHTLLHSAPLDYALSMPLVREWMTKEKEAESENAEWKRTLYDVPACASMTKLRPGIFAFLRSLSSLYEMHIYTMGEEKYATEMAKLLDPGSELFHRKVISREHSSTPMTKNLDIVIGSERSTVIVDDTWQVWTHHTANLLSVSKYCFFPALPHDTSGYRGWLEICADENPTTSDLSKVRSALERIHTTYFSLPASERDVRSVMKALYSRKRYRSEDG